MVCPETIELVSFVVPVITKLLHGTVLVSTVSNFDSILPERESSAALGSIACSNLIACSFEVPIGTVLYNSFFQ